jgi:hypothetical protein
MDKQNEVNGTASEPIARYDELPILRTYKIAFDNIVKIGGFWAVGNGKNLYHIEMPDKVKECMWKGAKRYDMQTGIVMGYTNADRIRSMSDEELAEQLYLLRLDALRLEGFEGFIETKDEVLEWLKEEAKGDKDESN